MKNPKDLYQSKKYKTVLDPTALSADDDGIQWLKKDSYGDETSKDSTRYGSDKYVAGGRGAEHEEISRAHRRLHSPLHVPPPEEPPRRRLSA